MGREWTLLQAVSELKQMTERRVVTREDAKTYLVRTRAILDSLVPADSLELEETYAALKKGKGAIGERT